MTARLLALSLCLTLAACDSEPAETPTLPSNPDPAPDPDPDPEPDPDPDPDPDPAATAEAAYRATMRAFYDGDVDRYRAGYADTLRCYGRRPNIPGRRMVRRRIARMSRNGTAPVRDRHQVRSLVLTVERESPEEVVFHDWGWTGISGGHEGVVFHAKRIIMERGDDGVWRIVGESPLGPGCGDGPARETPPRIWSILRDGYAGLVDACTGGTLEDGVPGIGGSNGCMCETNVMDAETFCAHEQGCADDMDACDDDALEACRTEGLGREVTYFCYLSEAE